MGKDGLRSSSSSRNAWASWLTSPLRRYSNNWRSITQFLILLTKTTRTMRSWAKTTKISWRERTLWWRCWSSKDWTYTLTYMLVSLDLTKSIWPLLRLNSLKMYQTPKPNHWSLSLINSWHSCKCLSALSFMPCGWLISGLELKWMRCSLHPELLPSHVLGFSRQVSLFGCA